MTHLQFVSCGNIFARVPPAGRRLNGREINKSGNGKNNPANQVVQFFKFVHCSGFEMNQAANLGNLTLAPEF